MPKEWNPEDWTEDDQREWEEKKIQEEIEKREDKIRLNKDLIKEKWKRSVYVKWVTEMLKRRDGGQCPSCGVRKWIKQGSGLHQKWICDDCGLSVTKRDLYKAQIYFDFVKVHALREIKRKNKARRHSQSVKTYESDDI